MEIKHVENLPNDKLIELKNRIEKEIKKREETKEKEEARKRKEAKDFIINYLKKDDIIISSVRQDIPYKDKVIWDGRWVYQPVREEILTIHIKRE